MRAELVFDGIHPNFSSYNNMDKILKGALSLKLNDLQ